MNIWTVFLKKINDNLLDRCEFFSSLKDECVSKKDYLHDCLFLSCHVRVSE